MNCQFIRQTSLEFPFLISPSSPDAPQQISAVPPESCVYMIGTPSVWEHSSWKAIPFCLSLLEFQQNEIHVTKVNTAVLTD